MKKILYTLILGLIMGSCTNNGGRDAIDVIMHRSSVRAYTAEPVSAQDIETMLRAGMAAPSAINYQPWSFVVIDERETLDAIAEMNPNAKMLKSAPLAIVVCGKTTWERGGEVSENGYWAQDCAAVTENILLAADYLGLGAVWTGFYPNTQRTAPLHEFLSLPEGIEPLNVIVIGHPAAEPQPKDKWDPARIHYNKW